MAAGIVLIALGVGLFVFILSEGDDSRGCLAYLVIPVALTAAGVYLVATDPVDSKPGGAVLGRYHGIALRDGQGVVVPDDGRPYRTAGGTGATVGLSVLDGRETLWASLLTRSASATYQGCAKALENAETAGRIAFATLRPGQAWCTREYGEYSGDRTVRMLRITGVRTRPARVTFDVTVWKAG